jgi:hypothetical protein
MLPLQSGDQRRERLLRPPAEAGQLNLHAGGKPDPLG